MAEGQPFQMLFTYYNHLTLHAISRLSIQIKSLLSSSITSNETAFVICINGQLHHYKLNYFTLLLSTQLNFDLNKIYIITL